MENGTQMTLEEFMSEIFQEQIVGVSDSLVKTSPLTDRTLDLKGIALLYFSELCTLLDSSRKKKDLNGYSSRTLRICFQLMEVGTSPSFSVAWTRGGYDAEWQVLNSDEFGVPQSRERCFVVGHFRGRNGHQILPISGTSQSNPMERIGEIPTEEGVIHRMRSGVWGIEGSVPATTATQSKDPYRLAIPIKEATKQGFSIAREEIDTINFSMPNSNTRRGRVGRDTANTLDTSCNQGILKKADDKDVPKIWYPKEQCYIAIRKLTPKECFRLQGWSDDYFEKAQFVNSDSQLYKQAGNGVTVNVIEAIARKF